MKKKAWTVLTFAAILSLIQPVYSFANPSFSRTEEEWARLRDNILEYTEIQGLIEEYNSTVLKNNVEYNKFKKEYGKTNSSVSNRYLEMADEIEQNLPDADPDSFSYAQALSSRASSLATAEGLRKSADSTLEDATIQHYQYEAAKLSLVQIAQANMISYYADLLSLDAANLVKEKAELDQKLAGIRVKAGIAVQSAILDADEQVLKASQGVEAARAQAENVRKKLIVMCGWSYSADAQIGQLPEMDFEAEIARMDMAKDIQTATENSLILKANLQRLSNVRSNEQKDSLNNTIAGNRQVIATTVTTAYQNVISARDAYNYAVSNVSLQQNSLDTLNRRLASGSASQYEVNAQGIAKKQADVALLQAKLALLQAINSYDWNLLGLAKAE